LKQNKKELYVATKHGRRQDNENGWPQNFSYDSIRKHVEDSLKNLGLDQLFLEQLHCIPTEVLRRGEKHISWSYAKGIADSEIQQDRNLVMGISII